LVYSPEREAALPRRMLPSNTISLRQLSREEGLSQITLFKWWAELRVKGMLLPDAYAFSEC
jgi:hypothetical protein